MTSGAILGVESSPIKRRSCRSHRRSHRRSYRRSHRGSHRRSYRGSYRGSYRRSCRGSCNIAMFPIYPHLACGKYSICNSSFYLYFCPVCDITERTFTVDSACSKPHLLGIQRKRTGRSIITGHQPFQLRFALLYMIISRYDFSCFENSIYKVSLNNDCQAVSQRLNR